MDPERWAALWSMMLDRWNSDKSNETGAFYLDQLNQRLDPEQITRGVEKVLYESTYFPSPAEIVEAACGSTEARAADQWDLCQRVMQGSAGALEKMDPAGRKTVALMGGPDRLRQTKLDSVPFVRKEFLRLYGHAEEIHTREQGQLPEWTEEGREIVRKLTAPDDEDPDAGLPLGWEGVEPVT